MFSWKTKSNSTALSGCRQALFSAAIMSPGRSGGRSATIRNTAATRAMSACGLSLEQGTCTMRILTIVSCRRSSILLMCAPLPRIRWSSGVLLQMRKPESRIIISVRQVPERICSICARPPRCRLHPDLSGSETASIWTAVSRIRYRLLSFKASVIRGAL